MAGDMHWDGFVASAPDLALRGRALLTGPHVALLGTIRRDGSPRISPIEPHFSAANYSWAS